MNTEGSVVLVTWANRGLGRAFVEGLLEAGAVKVYAGARDPASVETHGVIPVRFDVTAPADIDAAARECDDVTLVINNAGIGTSTGALADGAVEAGWREMETNVFGTLAVSRAIELAPQGILVVGVHCGFLDTDMTATIDAPKSKLPPRSVVEQVVSALSEGRPEVLADEITARVRAGLSGDLVGLYPSLVAS
jgi:NAD(P)-dependent dehydrogenase (short-subunit alcohol dehydrogenase family)